jgi:hypothetical protein
MAWGSSLFVAFSDVRVVHPSSKYALPIPLLLPFLDRRVVALARSFSYICYQIYSRLSRSHSTDFHARSIS